MVNIVWQKERKQKTNELIDVINNEYSLNNYLKTLNDEEIINVIKSWHN